MFKVKDKPRARAKVKFRIRRRLRGEGKRPRLAVFRSLKHIYVQAVDDSTGRTLASVSTMSPEFRSSGQYGGNVAAAKVVGEKIAEKLMEAGLKEVVFDRSGYIYHGRIQALAEAAREKGLRF